MPPPFTYLFGPVPSRRLGRSLGVDLTPRKTCTFDCVFCQLGPTTHKTVQRQAYVPTAAVIAELTQWLHAGGTADYITLAGSGEPTLHADFGAIIQFLRAATTIPVALLTNGSLLGDPAVRAAAAQANVVKASLSAWDQPSFASINRPHAALTCAAVVEGLRQFRAPAWKSWQSCLTRRPKSSPFCFWRCGFRAVPVTLSFPCCLRRRSAPAPSPPKILGAKLTLTLNRRTRQCHAAREEHHRRAKGRAGAVAWA